MIQPQDSEAVLNVSRRETERRRSIGREEKQNVLRLA
jgi:hypothetical protein